MNKKVLCLFAPLFLLLAIPSNSPISAKASNGSLQDAFEEYKAEKQGEFITGELNSSNCNCYRYLTDSEEYNYNRSSTVYKTGSSMKGNRQDIGIVSYEVCGKRDGNSFELAQNFTERKNITFKFKVKHEIGDKCDISSDTIQKVCGAPCEKVGKGAWFIFKKKGNKSDLEPGSYNGYIPYGSTYTKICQTNVTTDAWSAEFTPDESDLMNGTVYTIIFAQEIHWKGGLFNWGNYYAREVQIYNLFVGYNRPIGGFHLGQYSVGNVSNGITKKRYEVTQAKNWPDSTTKLENRPLIDNNYNRSKYSSTNSDIVLNGQIKSARLPDGTNAIVYKGTQKPTVTVNGLNLRSSSSNNVNFVDSTSAYIAGNLTDLPSIKKGGVLFEKSEDGTTWTKIENFSNVGTYNGQSFGTSSITLDPEDFKTGEYYRVTIESLLVLTTQHFEYTFLFFGHNVNDYTYTLLTEVCTFKVIDYTLLPSESNTVTYDNGDKSSVVEFNQEDQPLPNFYTMGEEAVSFTSINIDNLGYNSNSICYSYNGEEYAAIPSSNTFTEEGCYDFRIYTPFGSTSYRRLYIMKPGEDNGYSKYFGDEFIDSSMRIYNNDSLPNYQIGTKANIKTIEHLPGLYGTMNKINGQSTSEVFKLENCKEGFTYQFNELGTYYGEFYSNNPSRSGQMIKYTFTFKIVEVNEDTYKPTVNESIMRNANVLSNYKTKLYTFTLPTLGDGSFVFCYPFNQAGYSMALNFAYKNEYKNVKFVDEKFVYDEVTFENSILGKISLNDYIYKKLSEKIKTTYLADRDLYEKMNTIELSDIASIVLEKDVLVVENEDVRQSLLADSIILDHFSFKQIGKYETESVKLVFEDETEQEVAYDEDIHKYLENKASQRIKVVERNWCGENVYYFNYISSNDNNISINLKFELDGKLYDANYKTNFISLEGTRYVIFGSAQNKYDNDTVFEIEFNGNKQYFLADEINNLDFYQGDGEYRINAYDRLGNSATVLIVIRNGNIGASKHRVDLIDGNDLIETTNAILVTKRFVPDKNTTFKIGIPVSISILVIGIVFKCVNYIGRRRRW